MDAQNERSRSIQEEKRKHRAGKGLNAELLGKALYTGKVSVENTKNVVYALAGCCNPQPGDLIVGYMNKKGLRIHKATCLTFQRIPNIENRMIKVEWEKKKQGNDE